MKRARKVLDVPILDLTERGYVPQKTHDPKEAARRSAQPGTLVLEQQLTGQVVAIALTRKAQTAESRRYALDMLLNAGINSARYTASPPRSAMSVQRRRVNLPRAHEYVNGEALIEQSLVALYGAIVAGGNVLEARRRGLDTLEQRRRLYGRYVTEALLGVAVGLELGKSAPPENPAKAYEMAWEIGFDVLHQTAGDVPASFAQLANRFSPMSVELQLRGPADLAAAHTDMLSRLAA